MKKPTTVLACLCAQVCVWQWGEKLRHLLQIKHALSLSVDLDLFFNCVRAFREERHGCVPCKHSRKM